MIDGIPPLGDGLKLHLNSFQETVKYASCSAWDLLYETLRKNNLPVSTVSFSETGKPYFTESSIYFSLSHSRELCAVAVADRPVGVDIEKCRESFNPYLIKRSLCEAEKLVFDGDFTRVWCRKEALAKMTGEGITGYPDYIDTSKFQFHEQQIEWKGQQYWLVAVKQP